jgi:predicted transposase YbfD/YdcC
MARTVAIDIEEVLQHFSELEDPRSTINRQHALEDVVVIAIMAILAGATGPTSIAKWADLKSEFLLKLLPLPNGIPAKDVFRRVLMALKPDVFQSCFVRWLTALREAASKALGVERPTYAVDGKTLKRSHDHKRNLGAMHSVTIWASEFGLTLAQVATDEKSNEITAIPLALSLVDLEGAIITIDAMGTQTAIAQQIVAGKGDYILALKGNQETLFDAAVDYIDHQCQSDFQDVAAQRLETQEKGHGRTEFRTYIQMPIPPALKGADRWAGLLSLGVAILYSLRDGKEIVEARYFISSLAVNVKQFAHSVRSHWGIENSCHWCLDVTYREDESRIREKHLRENFAWLNRFTLSLLKQHPAKESIAMKRRKCGWSENYILEILTGQTT